MVDAVESVGALNLTQSWLASAQRLSAPTAALVVGFTVAIANNLVNNLPPGTHLRWHARGRSHPGPDLPCRSDRRRPWAEPFHHRFAGNDPLASRFEKRKVRCKFLGLLQSRRRGNACRAPGSDWRSHPDANCHPLALRLTWMNAGCVILLIIAEDTLQCCGIDVAHSA